MTANARQELQDIAICMFIKYNEHFLLKESHTHDIPSHVWVSILHAIIINNFFKWHIEENIF